MGLWESNTSVVLLGEAVECCTLDGESPIAESITSLRSDPSSMGHVESRVNQQGPPCKAKYSWVTDSEVVPVKITTSIDDMMEEIGGRPISKAKIEILFSKSEKFDKLMVATAEETAIDNEELSCASEMFSET
ncbi:hypothetical protein LWI28_020293 [Acer negundo]|uniref:Uncharacterized protein n=1 Tax=Acer negundo TaxID=4023 RepID=A0AAD5NUI3_ACENE|nr:hypothetical protein LWI28_020293 [Acer negundo]